ncbi:MAG: nitroreductase family protein [Anaerolineae bacterium]
METLMDLMYARRTIREFTDEAVTDEQVEAMLSKREMLDRLAQVHKYAHWLEEAPLAIVVCGDQDLSEKHWVEDTCVATQNLLLAATALGLGGVWISLYPKKKHQRYVRERLEIPNHLGVLCALAVGNPAEEKPPRTKYHPSRVHWEEW